MILKNGKSTQTVLRIFTNVLRYVFLLAFSYVIIYPVIFMISSAIKSPLDYFDPTVQWVPKNFSLESFGLAVNVLDFWNSLKSTFINEIIAALIQVLTCMLAAYGMSRFDFKGKKVLYVVMILMILIPHQIIILPSYINYQYLDFAGILKAIGDLVGKELRPSVIDTPLVFYLPSFFAVGLKSGFLIFIYTQFFKGLPKELEEAAAIDGAGPIKTFLTIIIPSSSMIICTVLLFSVIWHWNDYFLAQMYLSENFPLRVNLGNIYAATGYSAEGITLMNKGSVIMAGCCLVIAPILIFYLFIQKKFIASIVNSGIVG